MLIAGVRFIWVKGAASVKEAELEGKDLCLTSVSAYVCMRHRLNVFF